jgi:hypothetical protein
VTHSTYVLRAVHIKRQPGTYKSMPARAGKLAKANENKFRCAVLQLCYRDVNRCSMVGSLKQFGWLNEDESHQGVWAAIRKPL